MDTLLHHKDIMARLLLKDLLRDNMERRLDTTSNMVRLVSDNFFYERALSSQLMATTAQQGYGHPPPQGPPPGQYGAPRE